MIDSALQYSLNNSSCPTVFTMQVKSVQFGTNFTDFAKANDKKDIPQRNGKTPG